MTKARIVSMLIAAWAAPGCAAEHPARAEAAEAGVTASANAASQEPGNLSERVLAAHNRERAAVGAAPLSWDPALAASAAAYAPQLAQLATLAHSPRSTRRGQGENLWRGTGGVFGIDDIMSAWAAEKRLFRAGTYPEISRSGDWSDVSHYSQMIWPTTTHIGCAFHRAQRRDFLVCRYSPQGNVSGQRVP